MKDNLNSNPQNHTQLNAQDTTLLQEYLQAVDEMAQREPEKLPDEIWEAARPQIQATGEVPAEYRDRIAKGEQGYYDVIWERWNAERGQIESKYHDVIIKALRYALSNEQEAAETQSLLELLKKIIGEGADFATAWEKVSGFTTDAIPKVLAHRITKFDFPIDKVNNNVWQFLEDTKGQLKLNIDVRKSGSKKPVDVLYSLDFTSLENVSITRKLEPYDKRVYLAVAALFNSGYDVMSVQQIYNAMGYTGRMSATDIKKINAAVTKMSGARLYIDNLAEHNVYEYDHFNYDGSFLPMERIRAIINGQPVDAAIHAFREPPMVSFARERKQITTLDIKLLDTPLSKTNANIQLEDYLLEQIAHIKKKKIRPKMTYKTIYERAGITQKKQKQRAPEKIKQLLTHYTECGHITGFRDTGDGVEISY